MSRHLECLCKTEAILEFLGTLNKDLKLDGLQIRKLTSSEGRRARKCEITWHRTS